MNKKKLVKLSFTLAFLGATGLFYSCSNKGTDAVSVFNTNENAVVSEAPVMSTKPEQMPINVSEADADKKKENICVYICGQVKNPGVYEVRQGARVVDALDQAKGFDKDACEEAVNLAKVLEDGEQIYIPSKKEVKSGEYKKNPDQNTGANKEGQSGKVNLNTADESELTTIPGIGKSKAASILKYREKNGKFSSIEDIMKIEGIKEGVFSKIKDYITVE